MEEIELCHWVNLLSSIYQQFAYGERLNEKKVRIEDGWKLSEIEGKTDCK